MPFCLGSRLVTNLPLTEYLKTAAGGFRTIEIPSDPCLLSPYFKYTPAQRHALRIYQKQYQYTLTMHAPFIDCPLGALDPIRRQLVFEKMLNAMRVASELEITYFTFHPTTLDPEATSDYRENYRREEEALACLLREAKQLGLVLLMENMPLDSKFHVNTSDGSRCQELLWLFPENEFGLTIDVGHALQAGVSVDSLLKMERIRHFHLHENNRRFDGHLAITNDLAWWSRLVKKIAKKFPTASGILEMNRLEDQLTSYSYLKPLLKPQSTSK